MVGELDKSLPLSRSERKCAGVGCLALDLLHGLHMLCRNCGFEQAEPPECASCGVALEQRPATPSGFGGSAAASGRQAPPLIVIIAAALAVILIAALTLGGDDASDAAASPLADSAAAAPGTDPVDSSPANGGSAPAGRIAARLEDENPSRNPIERARNATVFLKTSWGSGSGFFVTADCLILTNRHVIRFGDGRISRMEDDLDSANARLEEARRYIREKARFFNSRCTDCSEEAWQRFIGEDLAALERYDDVLHQRRNQILDLKYYDQPQAILADGSEHEINVETVSDEYDLALLRMSGSGCPALQPGLEDDLQLGETLYTIGNPRGLLHKVTSGVFSGFVEGDDGERVIQTDAPINPGNSGGPLINTNGLVVGVNTAVLKDSAGIGLAIPISMALEELGLD